MRPTRWDNRISPTAAPTPPGRATTTHRQTVPHAPPLLPPPAHPRFFVGEFNKNRVRVFNTWPLPTAMTPARVRGKRVFLGNGQATSQSGLSGTAGLAYDS